MGNPNQIKKICLHQQPLLRFTVQIDPMLKWLQILKYWQMISIIVLDKFCFYYRQWIGSYVDRNIFVKETFASFHHLKPTTWVFLLNSILSKWWVPDIKHKVSEMNNINNFYILSLWNLFETEIVANGAVLPFKNLLSINKFWENGKVFLNFSNFCWSLDFLCTVSLIQTVLELKLNLLFLTIPRLATGFFGTNVTNMKVAFVNH